ncbi:acyl carrier protein [Nocardia sp. NPDC052566]|uniref:acyl carrier protein n=1 Tax=Nocardia sp. NPDC052566 TaxID=3364330 RepID=UPI0037C605BA
MNEPVIERITTLVSAILKDQLDIEVSGLSADTAFEELGVDSLVLVEVAVMVREEFGVQVTDEELAAGQTIGGAARIVTQRLVPST